MASKTKITASFGGARKVPIVQSVHNIQKSKIMKKTKATIAVIYLISLVLSLVYLFVVFTEFLRHISSGKEMDMVIVLTFIFSFATCLLSNAAFNWAKKKDEKRKAEVLLFHELNEAITTSTERMMNLGLLSPTFKIGGTTSSEVHKTDGAEKVHEALKELDKSIFEHLDRKQKRSHHSRKNAFDIEKAEKRGMAMYVDGKRHIYVGLKPSVGGVATEVRGISNGVLYGYFDHVGKGIHNANGKIKGYLINV